MISVNGLPVTPTIFPDGTSQVWKLPESIMSRRHVFVKWDFTCEAEFIQLAQLKDLLEHNGVTANLELSYLPYGRQDKQIRNDQTFALRTFASLLNSLHFYKVTCLDPHSSVAKELIENFVAVYPVELFYVVRDIVNPDVVLFPDEGSKEKYSELLDFNSIYAEKQRNQLTGEIEGVTIIGNPIDQKVLIFDDICDGGATFIRIAMMVRPIVKELNLFVTHGLFSKGLKPLKDAGISRVFTKDGEAFQLRDGIAYQPYKKEIKE